MCKRLGLCCVCLGAGCCPPRYAQEVYDLALNPSDWSGIQTNNHVQLYDQDPFVTAMVNYVIDFLDLYLPSRTLAEPAA